MSEVMGQNDGHSKMRIEARHVCEIRTGKQEEPDVNVQEMHIRYLVMICSSSGGSGLSSGHSSRVEQSLLELIHIAV